MLSKYISSKVLTIGCAYDPPKGGVAQVMYTYSKEVFPNFNCIINSGGTGKFSKLVYALCGMLRFLFVILVNRNIKIFHIHTASYNSFIRSSWYVRLAKMMRKKVVLHIHGGGFRDYYKTNPEWISKILLKADCIIALTDSWREFYNKDLHLPNVITIPNIVSNPQIQSVEHDNKLHLLFLGAINKQKGIFDLLDVINEHKNEWNRKLLLHVGGNQEVERLQKYIKEKNLEDLVVYEGWLNGAKKIDLLNLMDVFILPSYIEGLPISILESFAYGKPVITTPVGGIPEVVNEKNGFLISPGDKIMMSRVINGILCNPCILQEKAISAKQSVTDNFPDSISMVLNRVYNSLLTDHI